MGGKEEEKERLNFHSIGRSYGVGLPNSARILQISHPHIIAPKTPSSSFNFFLDPIFSASKQQKKEGWRKKSAILQSEAWDTFNYIPQQIIRRRTK